MKSNQLIQQRTKSINFFIDGVELLICWWIEWSNSAAPSIKTKVFNYGVVGYRFSSQHTTIQSHSTNQLTFLNQRQFTLFFLTINNKRWMEWVGWMSEWGNKLITHYRVIWIFNSMKRAIHHSFNKPLHSTKHK